MIDRDASTEPRAGHSAAATSTLLVAGESHMASYSLDGRDLVIGRGAECDVVIAHPTLSRRHARLRLGPPTTVQDLGSTNGTRIAGAIVTGGAPIPLAVGDSFAIGPFSFVLLASRAGTQSSARTGAEGVRIDDPIASRVPAVVHDLARAGLNALILGETGVGKEVLAQTLHALSGRTGPFVGINCAALAEPLLESELFGHEQGAFTGAHRARPGLFEAAAGGTAFLDEIGELSLELQAKLLRAIEAREVRRVGSVRPIAIDARFVAATNRDLRAQVAAGRFRADLFFRLDGVSLIIPPLRERREAIGPLAMRFIEGACGGATPRLAADVLRMLETHAWPGNVRELKATCERAVVLARGGELRPRHFLLPGAVSTSEPPPVPAPAPTSEGTDGLTAPQLADRARIIAALAECAGNQTHAAKALGLSRSTLATRLVLYRIPRPRTR
jgi:transcriptional regulator with GAF, ATPase, and Fis domain